MMIIKTAWRNVWRHPLRSLSIAGAVALGIWAGSCMMAFYFGMGEQRVRTAIQDETSHLQVHDVDFISDFGMGHPLENPGPLADYLSANDSVRSYCFRTVVHAMAATSHGSTAVKIIGIDPSSEDRTTRLASKLVEGSYLEDSTSNKVFAGEKLIRKLKSKIGKKIIITFNDTSNNLTSGAFKVCGIFRTASAPFDERTIYVGRNALNNLSGTPGAVYEIAVLLDSNIYLEKVKADLSGLATHGKVEDWQEIAPEIAFIVSATNRMLYIFMGIILIAVAFGIVNTMMMSILERNRELGMLMALGMSKGKVFSMVVTETLFLTLVGCPVGLLASAITIGYFHSNGLHLSVFEKTFRSFGYEQTVYPFLPFEYYVNILLMVAFIALLASLLPSRIALRIRPGIAIRK